MPHLDPTFALLAAVVFLAFATQALSGFGALALAVPLAAHLYGIEELKTLLVPTSLVATGAIVLRHRGRVDWALLRRAILPLMSAGAVLGVALAARVDGPLPQLAFAILVTAFATRELFTLTLPVTAVGVGRAPGAADAACAHSDAARPSPGLIFGAGVLHGLYATGGPLLVLTLGRAGLDKGRFRATLACVWLVLNVGMTVSYASEGRFDAGVLGKIALLAPVTFIAGLAGEAAHDRVPERAFRRLVFALLLVSGVAMVARTAAPLLAGPGSVARGRDAHAAVARN